MTHSISVPVHSSLDIVTARQHGRALASMAGFSTTEATIIAAAISEVARNIVEYATSGEVAIGLTDDGARTGVHVVARDQGPGMPDLGALAPRLAAVAPGLDEFGMGLHGARALMDEFDLHSNPGRGTTVTMTKWLQ
jgi:serine/threonine-protein kinase RsbT